MISNYLTRKHRGVLREHPKYANIDVCSTETIKRYIEAIEFVRTYNWMYSMKLKSFDKYPREDSLWELRNEIHILQERCKNKKYLTNHPFIRQLANRKEYLRKHLLLKHKNINLFND